MRLSVQTDRHIGSPLRYIGAFSSPVIRVSLRASSLSTAPPPPPPPHLLEVFLTGQLGLVAEVLGELGVQDAVGHIGGGVPAHPLPGHQVPNTRGQVDIM